MLNTNWKRCLTLFVTSEWVHSDVYLDDNDPRTTHHYFNSSWDLAQETIQATHPCKRTRNHLQQEVSLSEGVSHDSGHVSVPQHVDLSVERNGHSGTSITSAPVPAHEGAVISAGIQETDSQPQPGLPTSPLQQLDDTADLANQHSSIIKASPSPVMAMTLTGDDHTSPVLERLIPIMFQFGSLESPAK